MRPTISPGQGGLVPLPVEMERMASGERIKTKWEEIWTRAI